MRCEDCNNDFETKYVYVDDEGTCICKYCYDGNYRVNDEGIFVCIHDERNQN